MKKAGTGKKQEDAIYPILDDATAEDRLFVVCNGTGGHGYGDIAARTVCKGITKSVLANLTYDRPFTDTLLAKAVDSAYGMLETCKPNPEQKTGSTFAALLFHRGGCMAAHIGNSVIYQLRPQSNEVVYCSEKQSNNSIAASSSADNAKLIQSQGQHLTPETGHLTDIRRDDYFFVCTKGTMENMSEGELMGILSDGEKSDREKRDTIIERSKENKDSHSAYLIHVEGVINEDIGTSTSVSDRTESRKVERAYPEEKNDIEKKSAPVKEVKKKVAEKHEEEPDDDWSLKSDNGSTSYVKYIVSGIIAFAFVGILIYFMFAKNNTTDETEPTIEMSTQPAATDTVATATKQPANTTDTTATRQQAMADSAKIKAAMAKKAYWEKVKAAKEAAALAAQEAAAKDASAKALGATKEQGGEKTAPAAAKSATEKSAAPASSSAAGTSATKE